MSKVMGMREEDRNFAAAMAAGHDMTVVPGGRPRVTDSDDQPSAYQMPLPEVAEPRLHPAGLVFAGTVQVRDTPPSAYLFNA
jgi:hypothetical protein